MNKERITCRTHCLTWNSVDKDCEIYGIYHPCPRKCPYFLGNDYKKGFEAGKEFYESSYPFEKAILDGESEAYQKGFNDGFYTSLNNEYYNGYDVEVQDE